MTEQLIAPVQPGRAVPGFPGSTRPVPHDLPGPHAVDVVDYLFALVENADDQRIEGSLLDLAVAAGCDLGTARRAVSGLDPTDHVLSVDIVRATDEENWQLTWAPVTGVVDLMLDWGLHALDIAVDELSEWLGVAPALTGRALDWLAGTPGVTVVRRGVGSHATVRIAIVIEECPHTASVPRKPTIKPVTRPVHTTVQHRRVPGGGSAR